MTVLSVEQILKLHEMMLQSTGGAEGVRDKGALESAIYQLIILNAIFKEEKRISKKS